jgi:sugar phosphate isomerase/epimerase
LQVVPQQSFEIGLELYSLRREMAADVPGTLSRIRAMGFREVEVPGYYGLSAAEFRKALDGAALHATSLVAQWDQLEKGISAVANDLAILGASWAILPWIPHRDRFELSDAQRAATRMNAWAADFEKAGCHFAYHPHGYEFQPAPEGTLFDVLASKTETAVNFEMDTFWIAWPGQDCVRLLNKYPHRFRLLHLKDLKKGVTGNLSGSAPDEDSVAVGDGIIPWNEVLSVARRQGCEKYYIEDESPDAAMQIPRSLAFLGSLRF